MKAALATSIVLLLANPAEVVVDLFSPQEKLLLSLGKTPHTDEPAAARLKVGMKERSRLRSPGYA